MAQNKILPWAQTSTANALSDADYAVDVATGGPYADGVKSGQASSKQANKTWRQATAPGSGLAQFLVDNLGVDVTDSDTPATFSSRIANAVLKLAQISPFNQEWASATGGYRKYAIVSDSSGNFWVSTADQNTTVPGASGAKWQSLFDGYITESTADNRYVQFIDDNVNWSVQYIGVNKENSTPWFKSGPNYYNLQPEGDYATNTALAQGLASKQPLLGYTPVQQGTGINQSGNVVKIGWGNGPHAGRIAVTVDSTDVGALANVNDITNLQNQINGKQPAGDYATHSDLNTEITNRKSADTNLQNQINGKQPAGDYATHSDLNRYLKNTNGGIGGEQSGTSLVYQTSALRPFFSYNNNANGGNLAWYADVVSEATARTNADNNLQAQISAKMDSSFAASGIIAAGGAAGNGTIAGGTWLRVGNTLTQSFTVENISSGTITFPVAFSGSDNQVTCIFQTADGSASTFRPGQISTTSATFHSPGGGGASRMTVLAQGPYGT